MLSSELILINKFAQGKIELEEILTWLDCQTEKEQFDLILTVNFCLYQSHPSEQVLKVAIESLPVPLSADALEILSEYDDNLSSTYKALQLSTSEHQNTFIALLHVFKISDTERRNNYCKNDCYHEWHNLDNPYSNFVDKIIAKFKLWLNLKTD